MGTPNEESWPGVSELSDYKPDFPVYASQSLPNLIHGLDEKGLNLLSRMLQYDPNQRISAVAAMKHPYFDGLPHADA